MNRSVPSGWVERHLPLLRPHGRVLDLACGTGRHTRLLHRHGHKVVAVDRDLTGIADLRGQPDIDARAADLESAAWPLAGEIFDGIVVTNYLHRPHLARLIDNLADDGVLIYATFAAGQERYGRPRNPDFLLQPRELRDTFGGSLTVLAYEEVTETSPRAAVRQRLCAVGRAHPQAPATDKP